MTKQKLFDKIKITEFPSTFNDIKIVATLELEVSFTVHNSINREEPQIRRDIENGLKEMLYRELYPNKLNKILPLLSQLILYTNPTDTRYTLIEKLREEILAWNKT